MIINKTMVDFPNGLGGVGLGNEITAAGIPGFQGVSTSGPSLADATVYVMLNFSGALTAGQLTALDGVINAHVRDYAVDGKGRGEL